MGHGVNQAGFCQRSGSKRTGAVVFCLASSAAFAAGAALLAKETVAGGAGVAPPPEDGGAGRPRRPLRVDAGIQPTPPRLSPYPRDAGPGSPPRWFDATAPLPLGTRSSIYSGS